VESRFLAMTPADLEERVVVYRRKTMRQRERDAWIVHHLMAAFVGSKNAPSIDRLLGRVE
jgi:hypothetical protein